MEFSNNPPLNKETMLEITKYGKYYNPASFHYNNKQSVMCDRCYKQNLSACIGYDKYDLCLDCVNIINNMNNMNNKIIYTDELPKTRMMPSQFDQSTITDPTKTLRKMTQ